MSADHSMPARALALALTVVLAGCASSKPAVSPTPPPDPAERPRTAEQGPAATEQRIAELLQRAQELAGSSEGEHYRLAAVELLADSGDLLRARKLLGYVDQRALTPAQAGRYLLMKSELSVLLADGSEALRSIEQAPAQVVESLPPAERLRLSRLRATALDLTGHYLAAAMERMLTTASLVPPEQASRNREAIWQSLMRLPTAELAERARTHPLPIPRGWLQLAALTKQYQHDIDQQISSLDDWLMRHPQHPAALDLPGDLKLLNRAATERPDDVYLLLPLSGRYGPGVGQPIRNGFLSAYYAAMQNGRRVPEVHFINTDGIADIRPLYQELGERGADFIVGPFRRELVAQLASLERLPTPVLALNYTLDEAEPPLQLFQYGLSAEDEARSAAERAWADGHRSALAVVPDGAWGDRVLDAFQRHWQSLGGMLADTTRVVEAGDVRSDLAALLQVDRSRDRALRVQQTIGQEIEYIARRRQDADTLFMATLPRDARMIKPSLNALLAHDLPVYATSHIYSGSSNPRLDQDLDGIAFCDVPWNLIEPDATMTTVFDSWGESARASGRLYAMGIDAFSLFPRMFQMRSFPGSRFYGYTGALSLNRQQQIERELMWARFEDGVVVPLAGTEPGAAGQRNAGEPQ